MGGFLKISSIQDSTVKQLAEQSNVETQNDTLDTQKENETFTNLVISAFSKGQITTDVAKKYISDSNNVFSAKDNTRKAYVDEALKCIQEFNDSEISNESSTLSDKMMNELDKNGDNYIGHWIKSSAECEQIKAETNQLLKKANQLTKKFNNMYDKADKLLEEIDNGNKKGSQHINKSTNNNNNKTRHLNRNG